MTQERLSPETDTQDWFYDRYQAVYVSRNRWLVTAITALVLAALQSAALVALVPLKTSIPFLIKEEVSGAVTTIAPLAGDSSITYQESTRKYFLARYVVARETYDPTDLVENYRSVSLMSEPDVAREFNDSIAETNRRSPMKVYGQHIKRLIRVKSISFLNDHISQVRLTAIEKNDTGAERASEWIAIVGFRFGLAPALDADRFVNPLGFLVTSYRLDQEVL